MENKILSCMYCGQVIATDQDTENLTTKERNLLAIQHCDCIQASFAWMQSQCWRADKIKSANDSITKIFEEAEDGNTIDPDSQTALVNTLRQVVTPIVDGYLSSITITVPGGIKAKITNKGKDTINVERQDTVKQKQEV